MAFATKGMKIMAARVALMTPFSWKGGNIRDHSQPNVCGAAETNKSFLCQARIWRRAESAGVELVPLKGAYCGANAACWQISE